MGIAQQNGWDLRQIQFPISCSVQVTLPEIKDPLLTDAEGAVIELAILQSSSDGFNHFVLSRKTMANQK